MAHAVRDRLTKFGNCLTKFDDILTKYWQSYRTIGDNMQTDFRHPFSSKKKPVGYPVNRISQKPGFLQSLNIKF